MHMYLEKLDLLGFKSFANKTTFEFLPPRGGRFSITGIVGPNGSGKSNGSEGVRWVLGEQSMKMLRAKRGEDVIFSGTGGATRKSIADVTLTFNNEDRMLEDFGSRIEITRRLYRSGESEYLINKSSVRLSDLELFLARAQVGKNSYSVIGQGMIDKVVVAAPAERKAFFDEATGVKEFQLKREQTAQKLARARDNLREADLLIREIEPRLKTLKRQVGRLAEREEVTRQLEGVRKQYYGKRWVDLAQEEQRVTSRMKELTKDEEQAQRAHGDLLKKMRALEAAHTDAPALDDVQREYEELLRKRQETNEKSAQLQSAIAIAEARGNAQPHRAMVAADTLLDEIEALANEHRALVTSVERKDVSAISRALERVGTSIKNLVERLRKFKPAQPEKPDETAGARRESDNLRQELVVLDVRIREVREQIFAASKDASRVKTSFFDLQRELQAKQEAAHQAERALNDAYIQHTRVKTQLEALEQEIRGEAPELFDIVSRTSADQVIGVDPPALHSQMIDLRRRAEMIESIEPTVHDEHKELNERYEFLTAQTQDLTKSLADLEQVMAELDRRIATQRASAFEALNREFQHFFGILFDGGKAALVQIEAQETESETSEGEQEARPEDTLPKDTITGIDIQASPPGKRIQTVHTLSGGERAMTSIALLCAIMTINPSPFVVLDEVDAALDESNSARFAQILQELSRKVQFIVITHNRATMQAADALYGVTMGDDGVSHVVSMKLEEVKATTTVKI